MTGMVTYMLRRALCDWKAKEIVEDTVAYCLKNNIDEVMWITESPGSYKELLPIEGIRQITRNLLFAGKRLKANGIKHSIDIVTTLGHGDYGSNVGKLHPGMEFMADYTGTESKSCPCPLSPVWQELIKKTYALYASTHPTRLWANDDFRMLNHGPVRFGCYCNRHLKEFGRRIGKKISREELIRAILRPGKPHPWRALWFEFLEEVMFDTAGMLAEAVREISPETQMGWMATTPFCHELEGRHMGQQILSFAADGNAAIRMCTTQYYESNPPLILIEDEALKKAIPQLPEKTVRCTEIESMPHSIFKKSAAWLGAQMEWACALNVPNQTLAIHDYIGTPLNITPLYADMLRGRKNEFESVAQVFAQTPRFRGVGMISDPYSVKHVQTGVGKDMLELMGKDTGWADVIRACGMPIVCDKNEPVLAVTGQAFRGLDDDEIRRIFAGGVLLDLSALKTLADMGHGSLAGVQLQEEVSQRSRLIGLEELTDSRFGGGKHKFTWTYGASDTGRIGVLKLKKGARMISRILDPDLKMLFPGIVIYENDLGGRVATVPYDFTGKSPDAYVKGSTCYFYSEYRKKQIQELVRWLGRGAVPLMVQANGWVLPHRADGDETIALAAMNLNYDAWDTVTMECDAAEKIKNVKYMRPDGQWLELAKKNWRQSNGQVRLKLDLHVPALRMVGVVLKKTINT